MSNDDCRKTEYDEKRITANMICAGYPDGKKDSCQVSETTTLTVFVDVQSDLLGTRRATANKLCVKKTLAIRITNAYGKLRW